MVLLGTDESSFMKCLGKAREEEGANRDELRLDRH